MEIDANDGEYSILAEALVYIATEGNLPRSVSKIGSSSRGISSEQDFFFYNNFQKFKNPVKEINEESTSLLRKIGDSSHFWEKSVAFPDSLDVDDLDVHDWVVNANDEVFDKVDKSLDECSRRNIDRGKGLRIDDFAGDDGFQLVHGRKNRKGGGEGGRRGDIYQQGVGVGIAEVKAKPKIPFHIPTIPRPQDQYKIIVNNSNQPFEHVWLQRSEDGLRFIHPLEKLSVLDFVDRSIDDILHVKPPPVEVTPFKLVEEVKDLKQLAAKLKTADEFAVDLEHNQYRSFQGLTCLMQISTRTDDFIIDTLKLRIHVGPYLREVFKDPTKKKVMHGADRDIIWLQRDFGIYVCNMFDTGQASRVLGLERNSLEFLLQHFCGVTANKEYQNADWRLRPLPDEMVRYAREDTHYLLYIYDMMRIRLLSASLESENSNDPIVEVYKRSYDICMQLYEKELLTDSSFLHVYGLQDAGLSAEQLAVVAGLCEWRDVIARAEDESTGYILPNKTLIEIAKQMPLTTNKLLRLVKLKHPYIERNIGSVVSIIRHSIQNAPAFEVAVQQLKERQMERASVIASTSDMYEAPDLLENVADAKSTMMSTLLSDDAPLQFNNKSVDTISLNTDVSGRPQKDFSGEPFQNGTISLETDCSGAPNQVTSKFHEHSGETGVTVQVMRKPSRAFGALLGSSAKNKLHPDIKEPENVKLKQIKSSVNLPFISFAVSEEQKQPETVEPAMASNLSHEDLQTVAESKSRDSEQIIMFENGSDAELSEDGVTGAVDEIEEKTEDAAGGSPRAMDEGEGTISLSDLSSSFQKCFKSTDQTNQRSGVGDKHLRLKPFDYEAATKEVKFGDDDSENPGSGCGEDSSNRRRKGDRKSSSQKGLVQKDEGPRDPPQGKRRQAFPATGNRSATFR